MLKLQRVLENPILLPNRDHTWEASAAFNPSVVKAGKTFHLLYRAMSSIAPQIGINMPLSTVGYAKSVDGIHFTGQRLLIEPEYDWEVFGCEDPRVTKLGQYYYIFYTALSTYPFSAEGIKIGLAVTKDFQHIEAKYPVTPFNAKAMALFPEKINGKFAAVLTVHTDKPPAKIAVALFDKESDLWSPHYWQDWYANLDSHVIPLLRSSRDHLEVGAAPVKTSRGWLLIHSYIQNYFSSQKVFSMDAVLLDLKNPLKVVGRTSALMIPEKEYELSGNIAHITFPSSALIEGNELWVYYGAADTVCCLATLKLKYLLDELTEKPKTIFIPSQTIQKGFERYHQNPIIAPRPEFTWEQKGTLNPAAFYDAHGVHIIYRAFSADETSTLGYARLHDGLHVDERPAFPVYVPREDFEKKHRPGFSGCEDPRITPMGQRLYMLYTAYDGDIPRVAMTFIQRSDFLREHWNWEKPKVISAPGVGDKNACLFPKKIDGEYVILHRVDRCIYIDFVEADHFRNGSEYLTTNYLLMRPRVDKWDNRKIGSSAPPIETPKGWLLLYHGCSDPGAVYKVGAVLLDLKNPRNVIARTDIPLIVPEMNYEKEGFVHNVVFPCGAVVIKDMLYLYYGAGDFVIGVAVMPMKEILQVLSS